MTHGGRLPGQVALTGCSTSRRWCLSFKLQVAFSFGVGVDDSYPISRHTTFVILRHTLYYIREFLQVRVEASLFGFPTYLAKNSARVAKPEQRPSKSE